MQRLRLPPGGGEGAHARLRAAGVHHLRGRSLLALADQYCEAVWDAHPRARRFFSKHRGLGAAHSRAQLPDFRRLYLRAALAAAERAVELAGPDSLECQALRVCVLWALCTMCDGAAWATRLLSAAERGLAPSCGAEHEAEAGALYGTDAPAAAQAHERRALLTSARGHALRILAATGAGSPLDELLCAWTQKFAVSAAADVDDGDDGALPEPWTPWSSPWRGLDTQALL